MRINVLWIDDQPNDAFLDKAYAKGIDIKVEKNVDAGIEAILAPTSSFDAIILDANCVSHKKDDPRIPDVCALQYALRCISENRIQLPWFVYSGGGFSGEESISVLVKGYERPYDNVDWYKKPLQMNELFDKILQVVPFAKEFQAKQKHAELFSWYPNQKELLDIIMYVENDNLNNPSVFNKIRKELDWVMDECYNYGLLYLPYSGSDLARCSRCLSHNDMQKYVPLHVQRSFHSATSISNDGSHRLKVDELVKSGKAPYLVQSIVFELLNILHWLKNFPQSDEGKELQKDKAKDLALRVLCRDYEGKDMEVTKDENGFYHCGDCLLARDPAYGNEGKKVKLTKVMQNKSADKNGYALYAHCKIIE